MYIWWGGPLYLQNLLRYIKYIPYTDGTYAHRHYILPFYSFNRKQLLSCLICNLYLIHSMKYIHIHSQYVQLISYIQNIMKKINYN